MSKATHDYSPFWRLISVMVLAPLLRTLIRNRWEGQDNIPKTGGVILAPNHISYADWGTDALFCQASGRYPVFLIKSSAFEIPLIGPFLHKCGQLPVHRGRADAALVLREAEKRLAEGEAVVIYPEGTATRDPDLWPMLAKTGVARLALATGAPVIPVAHWGTQDILKYGTKNVRLFPRKTVRTVAGRPVDLSRWAGKHTSARAQREATNAIMGEVAALLGEMRGQTPPAVPYDPAPALKTAAGATKQPQVPPAGEPDGEPGDGSAEGSADESAAPSA